MILNVITIEFYIQMLIKGINPKTKLKKGMWNYGSKTYENFDYRG